MCTWCEFRSACTVCDFHKGYIESHLDICNLLQKRNEFWIGSVDVESDAGERAPEVLIVSRELAVIFHSVENRGVRAVVIHIISKIDSLGVEGAGLG